RAELAVAVVAPAVSRPDAREPAGVAELAVKATGGARGERAEAQPPGDRDRRCAIRGRTGAELALAVVPPAVGRPGVRDPAGVAAARGEGAEAQAPGDGDRCCAARARAGAERAVGVVAPPV